jgi:hypothetical protein
MKIKVHKRSLIRLIILKFCQAPPVLLWRLAVALRTVPFFGSLLLLLATIHVHYQFYQYVVVVKHFHGIACMMMMMMMMILSPQTLATPTHQPFSISISYGLAAHRPCPVFLPHWVALEKRRFSFCPETLSLHRSSIRVLQTIEVVTCMTMPFYCEFNSLHLLMLCILLASCV